MKNTLLYKLKKYNKTHTAMHMPGHKRNTQILKNGLPYGIDITEIDGFDNLHDMIGVLKETADFASSLYGSVCAFPLVNGSTCGILAGISALSKKGDHILVGRNCHKSVYNAIELFELFPHYVFPKTEKCGILGNITPESVEKALENCPEISLVVITSPTYEGVLSDIEKIYDVCKSHNTALLIDSAHGAHFGISENAFSQKIVPYCDIAIMSLHKTLPSLTQTALLHICSSKVSKEKVKNALSVFETSSPSYVLLSSIDECLRFVSENKHFLSCLDKNLKFFYERCKKLKYLDVFHFGDLSKIIISTDKTDITGSDLSALLRKHKIEVEMVQGNYCLAMATIGDTKRSLNKLLSSLIKIDKNLNFSHNNTKIPNISEVHVIEKPFDAKEKDGVLMDFKNALNSESLEYVWSYPPGIPIICPGERITPEMVEKINKMKSTGVEIKSTKGFKENKIYVSKS